MSSHARRVALVAIGTAGLVAAVLPGAATGAGTAYVSNNQSSSVSQFAVTAARLLSPLTPATVAGIANETGLVLTPDGRFAYESGLDAIAQYAVAADGTLTPLSPATLPAPGQGEGLAMHPDGTALYLVDGTSVRSFAVRADGTLEAHPGGVDPSGDRTLDVAVTPDGRSVYAANANTNTVTQYDVAADHTLSPKATPSVAMFDPSFITVSPDGESAYATSVNADDVTQFDIGPGGALVPKTPAVAPAAFGLAGIVISPDGDDAYAASLYLSLVAQFDVAADGTLTLKTPATVPAGSGSIEVALSPDGRGAYTADSGDVTSSQYLVADDGTLTAASPATVAVGARPLSIVTAPNQGPAAAFAAQPAPPGSASSFDGSASADRETPVARWDWDFGDGTIARDAGATPSHTYATAGAYPVTLTVTDGQGCADRLVYNGRVASCNGTGAARLTRTVAVTAAGGPKVEAVAPALTPAVQPPPRVLGPRPVISRLEARRRCVGAIRLTSPTRGKDGLAFDLTLSERARVTYVVSRRAGSPGRTSCPSVAGTTPGRATRVSTGGAESPAGLSTTSLGSAASVRTRPAPPRTLRRGRTRIPIGQIAQARSLRPGTYILDATAVDADGLASTTARVKFWVLDR
jgi:6-phosphogluconolactonase (cycloisomerase 2 family)